MKGAVEASITFTHIPSASTDPRDNPDIEISIHSCNIANRASTANDSTSGIIQSASQVPEPRISKDGELAMATAVLPVYDTVTSASASVLDHDETKKEPEKLENEAEAQPKDPKTADKQASVKDTAFGKVGLGQHPDEVGSCDMRELPESVPAELEHETKTNPEHHAELSNDTPKYTYKKLQKVEALFCNGCWYPAEISEVRQNGLLYLVNWEDGDQQDRLKFENEV
jgi:hypothetical protein